MRTSYIRITESQDLLNRTARGFIIAAFVLLYLAVTSPLWFAGFMLQQRFFKGLKGGEQLVCIGCFAVVIYAAIWLLKGLGLGLIRRGKPVIGVILLVILTGFACIAPAVAVFTMIGTRHPAGATAAALLIFVVTYCHYQFHAEGAPKAGFLPYRWGGGR